MQPNQLQQPDQPRLPEKPDNHAIGTIVAVIIVILVSLVIAVQYTATRKSVEPTSSKSTSSTKSSDSEPRNIVDETYDTMASRAKIKARDTERKTDILALNNQAEVYFAKTGGYPAMSDINNPAWRKANEFNTGIDDKALADPLYPDQTTLLSKVPKSVTGGYTYNSSPAGCMSPTDASGAVTAIPESNLCYSFIITALLEDAEDKNALTVVISPDITQYQYIKKYVSTSN